MIRSFRNTMEKHKKKRIKKRNDKFVETTLAYGIDV